MRALVPVVMASIIAIYGLVAGVVISSKLQSSSAGYTLFQLCLLTSLQRLSSDFNRGASHLASGLACGGCCMGAGYAVGISGDSGVCSLGAQPKNFIGFVLVWSWGQLLGLYGLLVALVMAA